MQNTHLIKSLPRAFFLATCLFIHGRGHAQESNPPAPTLNRSSESPESFLGPEPAPRQRQAFVYITSRSIDEPMFIKCTRTVGAKKKGAGGEDEFAAPETTQDNAEAREEQANREALAWAHQVQNGQVDLAVSFSLPLLRYNIENQSFITGCRAPVLDLRMHGYPDMSIGPYMLPGISSLSIHGFDIFESICIPADSAKTMASELSTVQATRAVFVFAKVRLRPNSAKRDLSPGDSQCYSADIREYKIGFMRNPTTYDPLGLTPAINAKYSPLLTAAPYRRTESERKFLAVTKDRAWFSKQGGMVFRESGLCFRALFVNYESPTRQKIDGLSGGLRFLWFIMNNKLFIYDTLRDDQYSNYSMLDVEYSVEGQVLRLNGVPYVEDTNIRYDGDKIINGGARTDVSKTEPKGHSDSTEPHGQVPADSGEPKTIEINVPCNVAWFDTGVTLHAGQVADFRAEGEVQIADPILSFLKVAVSPAGRPEVKTTKSIKPSIAPDLIAQSLVGRIGVDGTPFQVGGSASVQVDRDGKLYLAANCQAFKSNSGTWKVVLTVTH